MEQHHGLAFIGCALVTVFFGLSALFLVICELPNRRRFQQLNQTRQGSLLLCILVALELCVLSQVVGLLFLALAEFGVIDPPVEGPYGVFWGYLILVAPYMLVVTSLLFVFVVLLAFLWRKNWGKAE